MFYKNVLHIMSHNFSQLSPMRYISNYFSSQSMVVRRYFCQWRPRLKHSPHKEKKGPYPPPPPQMEKMTPKKRNNAFPPKKTIHMEKKAPINKRGEKPKKSPPNKKNPFFLGGGGRLPTLAPLLSKIVHHVIISKYTLKCTKLNYFFKKFLGRSYPRMRTSSNKIELRYTHRMTDNASGMHCNTSRLSKKVYPHVGTWIFTIDK